jgi:hypothetical protein
VFLQEALSQYDPVRQAELRGVLERLEPHIIEQLEGESHVENGKQVMKDLLEALGGAEDPWKAFQGSCEGHLLEGDPVPGWQEKTLLGRAVGQEGYSRELLRKRALPGMSSVAECEAFFNALAQRANLSEQQQRLADVPLGFRVLWATFNEKDGSQDPFNREGYNPDTICNNLGLGHLAQQKTLMTFVYCLPPGVEPRCPTVFDNRGHQGWQPAPADAPHGWTQPVDPGGTLRPEVVHEEVNGGRLERPFQTLHRP